MVKEKIMEKCTVNRWPRSQICSECKHGAFVNYPANWKSDYISDSMYICFLEIETDGIHCDRMEEYDKEEDD